MKNKLRVNSFSSGGQAGCSKGMTDSPFTFFYSDIEKQTDLCKPVGKISIRGQHKVYSKISLFPKYTYIE